MTIEELLTKINRGLRAGHFTELDSVYVRNPGVSAEAMSAGSNGWTEADEVLVIEGDAFLDDGIYLGPGDED
jgi:hypothetical protein